MSSFSSKREISPLRTLKPYNLQEDNALQAQTLKSTEEWEITISSCCRLVSQRVDRTADGKLMAQAEKRALCWEEWQGPFHLTGTPPTSSSGLGAGRVRRCPFLSAELNKVLFLVISRLWTGFHISFFMNDQQHPCRGLCRPEEENVFSLESKQYALTFAFQNWEMSLSKLPTPCRKDKGTFYSAQNKTILAVLMECQPCTVI